MIHQVIGIIALLFLGFVAGTLFQVNGSDCVTRLLTPTPSVTQPLIHDLHGNGHPIATMHHSRQTPHALPM